MLDDIRRLLDADGLDRVPVLAVSAREGTGIAELKSEIARRAADKLATSARVDADVKGVADRISAASGSAPTRALSPERVRALDDAFAEAAGVPTVVEAVERSTRMRVGLATGWPVVSLLSGVKPDPVKRLQLDLGDDGRELSGRARTALPEATQVQRARVDAEVRALADDISDGLTQPWVSAVRRASTSRLDELGDRLDAALASTDLGGSRPPVWAGAVRVLQWLLLAATVAGLAWTAVLVGSGKLQDGDTVRVGDVALGLVLLVGGLVLGIVLGLVCLVIARGTARRRAADADERLRASVSAVSQELVVAPVEAELTAYKTVRSGVDRALA